MNLDCDNYLRQIFLGYHISMCLESNLTDKLHLEWL